MQRRDDADEAYLEHLSDTDLSLLLADAAGAGGSWRARAREHGVEPLLAAPSAAERVLGPGGGEELALVSPFLVFAVAVQRTAARLEAATHVLEWVGPGRRAPVFDAPRLREFVADPWRRLSLAELLASYSRVTSGSFLVATRRGWRRQRFSELDPVRLAGLLDVVPAAERPGVLRRLGDLALFLTGVFPDHVARRGFGAVEEGRLRRSVAGPAPRQGQGQWQGQWQGQGHGQWQGPGPVPGRQPAPRTGPAAPTPPLPAAPLLPGGSAAALVGDGGPVGMLADLGRRWYRAAYELMGRPAGGRPAVVGELGHRFDEARRVLEDLTAHHLFGERERYFGA